jgi:hypothetical protein
MVGMGVQVGSLVGVGEIVCVGVAVSATAVGVSTISVAVGGTGVAVVEIGELVAGDGVAVPAGRQPATRNKNSSVDAKCLVFILILPSIPVA